MKGIWKIRDLRKNDRLLINDLSLLFDALILQVVRDR